MEPLAKRRSIRLRSDLHPAPAAGDADWCRQVISGLIENALKHSPTGAQVIVRTSPGPAHAIVTVTDDGPGLPDSEIGTVFQRFARGSREVMGSGFGVGLALARWVIERQNGSIDLQSPACWAAEDGPARGPGVTVKISLPGGTQK